MKRVVLIPLLLILSFGLSAVSRSGVGRQITPEFLFHSHTALLGLHYETPFSGRLNIGGEAAFGIERAGYFWLSPELIYHFDLNVPKVDLFAGIGPVFTIGYKGGTDFAIKPLTGVRLLVGRNTSLFFKLYFLIDNGTEVGAALGLSFRL